MSGTGRNMLLPPARAQWLLLAQAAVVLPHVVHMPPWITAACVALGVWRWLASRYYWRPTGRLLRAVLLLAAVDGVYLSYGTLFGRDAGVALLVLLVSLKLLELQRLRDVTLFLFLGYFLLTTRFLFSQSMLLAAYALAAVVVLTSALIAVNHPAREPQLPVRLRQAGVLVAQALPVALLLFLVFPRVPGPLWSLPRDAHQGVTGLSDTMRPGAISALSRSDAVAFRVDFDGPAPPRSQLYWRGPVLERFDGYAWTPGGLQPRNFAEYRLKPPAVRYTVTLEPSGQRWLLALDIPGTVPPGALITQNYQLLAPRHVEERLRYSVVSYPHYGRGARLGADERRRLLQTPPNSNPRTLRLARTLRRESHDDMDLIRRVLRMFHQQPFIYTLNPPRLPVTNAMDAFLFDTRRGFCEHYAGAFTLLMRDAGIPARVVTGYQGGEYNPLGGYFIVRQADAHAWSEVWLRDRGWVRIDPTSAIAPQRVEPGAATALADQQAPNLGFTPGGLLRRVGLLWDTINNGWNQWVLGYGQQRQARLWSHLGLGPATWQRLAMAALVSVGAVLLALFVYLLLNGRQGTAPDRVQETYRRFCRKLARGGFARRQGEGPLDFASRVARARPDLAGRVRRITQLYVALRYGPAPDRQHLHKLRQLVRRLSVRRARVRA
jgi:transglutaminase-like putative cysteine protease